jgi:hypothetical protein
MMLFSATNASCKMISVRGNLRITLPPLTTYHKIFTAIMKIKFHIVAVKEYPTGFT